MQVKNNACDSYSFDPRISFLNFKWPPLMKLLQLSICLEEHLTCLFREKSRAIFHAKIVQFGFARGGGTT